MGLAMTTFIEVNFKLNNLIQTSMAGEVLDWDLHTSPCKLLLKSKQGKTNKANQLVIQYGGQMPPSPLKIK